MILQRIPSEDEVEITSQGAKICDNDDLQHFRIGDVDILNCSRLKLEIDNDDEIDCNELIAYWMVEGYLGHVDSVKQAYRKGHEIFTDLKYVKMPRAEFYQGKRFTSNLGSNTTYKRYRGGFYGTIGLGFVDVFDFGKGETPKFGELVPDNGVLRTLGHGRCSTLLLDGNHLDRQAVGHFNKQLKHFAYFNPRPSLLQHKLPGLNLSVLVLRGCAFLEEINECIGEMSALTILEISGPNSSIKTIPDIFKNVTKLRSLNLSYLAFEALPEHSFPNLVNLRWLILRGCSRLIELPSISDMTKLEVIDLHGATSFKKFSTAKLRKHPIRMLDLSGTRIPRIPCLINITYGTSSSVTHLFLRNCLDIFVFEVVERMFSLQVLDLSGAKRLREIISLAGLRDLVVLDLSRTGIADFPQNSQRLPNKLQELNLSQTNIRSLHDISHLSSLSRLIVQGCLSLEIFEAKGLVSLKVLDISGCENLQCLGDLSDLEKLIVLDLGGCTSLQKVEEIPFERFTCLRTLNLSKLKIENLAVFNTETHFLQHFKQLEILGLCDTSVRELPFISCIKTLKQLLLAGCLELKSVPDLKELTELEVLDLSRTNIGKEFLHNAPSSLRKLLLKDCPRIVGSLPLASLTQLQQLDLRGSGVTLFPSDIAGMTYLNRLFLPEKIDIRGVDLTKMKDCLPKEIIWDQPTNVFDSVDFVISNGIDHPMLAKLSKSSSFFRLVDEGHSWEAYFKQFQFSVSPKEGNRDAEIQFAGAELVFKGHNLLGKKISCTYLQVKSVEIHGFSSFPEDTKSALKEAAKVALVDNSFVSSLSDECFEHMEAMKVCWINSCTEMKFVFGENRNAGVLGSLETLVLSNLTSLKAFCAESENVQSQHIEALKHMYIDCCPVLNKIISVSCLPKNLETLQIKFCDELEAVCDGNASESKLQQLYEMNLLDLPKLKQIGADLPALQTLVISRCPNFDVLEMNNVLQCARFQLTRLTLDSCPLLKHVFSSSMLPKNIIELVIRSCDELTVVFDSAGSSSSTSLPSLPSLRHLQLWNLPKLKSIGVSFPSLETRQLKYCPRLLQNLWPQVKT